MVTEHPLRVMVVDDELLLRWSLSEVLRRHGHTVVEATSASTCREAMEDGEPIDVVLLDFRLPDSQTLDLLREILGRRPQAAVVLMTAYGTAEFVENALALGASCVITKPFDMNAVEDVVQRAHRDARLH